MLTDIAHSQNTEPPPLVEKIQTTVTSEWYTLSHLVEFKLTLITIQSQYQVWARAIKTKRKLKANRS